jgi:hypothetical protein
MPDKREDDETGFETSSELRQYPPAPPREDRYERDYSSRRRTLLVLAALFVVLVSLILLLYFVLR